VLGLLPSARKIVLADNRMTSIPGIFIAKLGKLEVRGVSWS